MVAVAAAAEVEVVVVGGLTFWETGQPWKSQDVRKWSLRLQETLM